MCQVLRKLNASTNTFDDGKHLGHFKKAQNESQHVEQDKSDHNQNGNFSHVDFIDVPVMSAASSRFARKWMPTGHASSLALFESLHADTNTDIQDNEDDQRG